MVSYIDALKQAARTAFCMATSPAENAFDFWDKVGLPDPVGIRGTAANIYRSICNKEPPPPPPNTYPKGQCPVQYRFIHVYSSRSAPDKPWVQETRQIGCPSGLFGPITVPEVRTVAGARGMYIDVGQADGSRFLNYPVTNFTTVNPQVEFRTDSWTPIRCDGGADDCGTGTVQPPQPGYRDVDIDITYTNEENVNITIPTTINIGSPVVNIDNEITIPITYNQIDAELNIPVKFYAEFNVSTGDINLTFGGNDGADRRPGDNPGDYETDNPLPTPPSGGGGGDSPAPEKPEQEKRIVAVVVTVTQNNTKATSIAQPSNLPILFVPDLGNIRFLIRVNAASRVWTGDIPVRQLRQFIPCPWDAGAVDVQFSPRPGAIALLNRVYRKFDVIEDES